jgi:hypothetical protein
LAAGRTARRVSVHSFRLPRSPFFDQQCTPHLGQVGHLDGPAGKRRRRLDGSQESAIDRGKPPRHHLANHLVRQDGTVQLRRRPPGRR